MTVFNHVMRGQVLTRRLVELDGTCVSLCATEWPWALEVKVEDGRLRIADPGATAQVRIRGSLADLRRLAARSEDPDTLFFERRLCIEGETHTGLLIKNMLDALDWDWETHLRSVLGEPLANLVILAARRMRQAQSRP